jgi:hypothetical protein
MTARELIRQLRRSPGNARVLFVGPMTSIEVTRYALFEVPKVEHAYGVSPLSVDFVIDAPSEEPGAPPIVFLTADIPDAS